MKSPFRKMLGGVAVGGLAAALAIAAACGGSDAENGAPNNFGDAAMSASETSAPPMAEAASDTATPPADAGIKAGCRGLMSRSGPPASKVGFEYMDSTVVQLTWTAIESSLGVYESAAFTAVDDALTAGYKVRLRIQAGIDAPDYVKKLGGPARSLLEADGGVIEDCSSSGGVGVFDPAGKGTGGCMPYVWTAAYQARYRALMEEVARRYESKELFAEVVDSMCQAVYAEVLFRQHCDPGSTANMIAAGFTSALDQTCQENALKIHADVFPRTRTSLAVNTWDRIDPPNTCISDLAPATALADWGRTLLGDRLVVQHNHLSPSDPCPGAPDSCYISQFAGERGFQTQGTAQLGPDAGALLATLKNAAALKADFVELPDPLTPGLAAYDAPLRANP